MRARPDWVAHGVLGLGVLLFALPIWLVFAGSTQDAGAIARGEISLIPTVSGLRVYPRGFAAECQWGDAGMAHVDDFIRHGTCCCDRENRGLGAVGLCGDILPISPADGVLLDDFITLMLPPEVHIIPTYKVMSDLSLINTFPGLTLPLIASATATLLFRQVFLVVPDELLEAARMDGPVHGNSCVTFCCRYQAPTSRHYSSFYSSTAGTSICCRCSSLPIRG